MVHIKDYAMVWLVWIWNWPPQSQVSAWQPLGNHFSTFNLGYD